MGISTRGSFVWVSENLILDTFTGAIAWFDRASFN